MRKNGLGKLDRVPRGSAEAQVELAESSPLPPDRGPAGMGWREVSMEQFREEIEEERRRYIAYHLLHSPRTR